MVNPFLYFRLHRHSEDFFWKFFLFRLTVQENRKTRKGQKEENPYTGTPTSTSAVECWSPLYRLPLSLYDSSRVTLSRFDSEGTVGTR